MKTLDVELENPAFHTKTSMAAAALALTACGGGGSEAGASAGAQSVVNANSNATSNTSGASAVSYLEASRFLSYATLGATAAEIAALQELSKTFQPLNGETANGTKQRVFEEWLNRQMGISASEKDNLKYDNNNNHVNWLLKKYNATTARTPVTSTDNTSNPLTALYYFNSATLAMYQGHQWNSLITSPQSLRQRVTLALSEIIVCNVFQLNPTYLGIMGSNFVDILEKNAFGSYEKLLLDVTLSPAMGLYLTYNGNAKADPIKGSLPDENYAREIMQLFTIGMAKLNDDGTLVLEDGQEVSTYTQEDVSQLARVFTGWVRDANNSNLLPENYYKPMVQAPEARKLWESDASTILGVKINKPTAIEQLTAALSILTSQSTFAPFVCKQLIQKLVTSNPSKEYIKYVVAAFRSGDPGGPKGNLGAAIKAIFTAPDFLSIITRDTAYKKNLNLTGKLREPMVRFMHWARAFNLKPAAGSDPDTAWTAIVSSTTWDSSTGQLPFLAPSVFNFYSADYAPQFAAKKGIVAPEFQLLDEVSTVSYTNYMQYLIFTDPVIHFYPNGKHEWHTLKPDYSAFYKKAAKLPSKTPDYNALVTELNAYLTGGNLSIRSISSILKVLNSLPAPDFKEDSGKYTAQEIKALDTIIKTAVFLIFVCPEYLVQK